MLSASYSPLVKKERKKKANNVSASGISESETSASDCSFFFSFLFFPLGYSDSRQKNSCLSATPAVAFLVYQRPSRALISWVLGLAKSLGPARSGTKGSQRVIGKHRIDQNDKAVHFLFVGCFQLHVSANLTDRR